MKKIYTIEITSQAKQRHSWYRNKVGLTFEAELFCRGKEACFKVSSMMFVRPTDCTIISERIEEKYLKAMI